MPDAGSVERIATGVEGKWPEASEVSGGGCWVEQFNSQKRGEEGCGKISWKDAQSGCLKEDVGQVWIVMVHDALA